MIDETMKMFNDAISRGQHNMFIYMINVGCAVFPTWPPEKVISYYY